MKKAYCIFAAQYLPHVGGVERYTYNLARKLVEKGSQVVVVTSNTGNLPEYEQMEGIEVYRYPCINLINGRYPVLRFLSSDFRRLYRRLGKYHFSLVIVNTRFYFHSVCGVRFGKKSNVRTIVIDHGTSHLSVHNRFADWAGGMWEHFITCIDMHYCQEYYGVSKASAEWLRHFHIKARGVIYNAIDLDQIEELKRTVKKCYREKYQIPKGAKVIAFTGRLLEEKGIRQLISAVEKITRDRKDVFLFLAGDGELEPYVKAHKSNHIIPTGRLPFEEIIRLLLETDIFCLPSFSEGFSTSILEAVACGCYIITTERGGAKEFIINKDYGTIIQDNDEKKIYTALMDIMDYPEQMEKASRNAYEVLKTHYTWEIIAAQVSRLSEPGRKETKR